MAFNEENILGSLTSVPFVDLTGLDHPDAPADLIAIATPRPGFSQSMILGSGPDRNERFASALSDELRIARSWNRPVAFNGADASPTVASQPHPFQTEIDAIDRALQAHRAGDMDAYQKAMDELLRAQARSAMRASAQRPGPSVETADNVVTPMSQPPAAALRMNAPPPSFAGERNAVANGGLAAT